MEISQFNPEQIDEVARMAASVWGRSRVHTGQRSPVYSVDTCPGTVSILRNLPCRRWMKTCFRPLPSPPEFSTDKEDYTYYMFRKRIL